jgi:hypothetical protein
MHSRRNNDIAEPTEFEFWIEWRKVYMDLDFRRHNSPLQTDAHLPAALSFALSIPQSEDLPVPSRLFFAVRDAVDKAFSATSSLGRSLSSSANPLSSRSQTDCLEPNGTIFLSYCGADRADRHPAPV